MTPRPMANSGARRTSCPRCARPVLRQLVGNRAALDVIADDTRLTPADAALLRGPDRLDWCVRATKDGTDLRWADCRLRSVPCRYEHVVDHACTGPAAPAPPTARRKTPSVSAGQLTL